MVEENNVEKESPKVIIAHKSFEGLPNIIKSKDGKIYKIGAFDAGGRYNKTKEIPLKKLNGSEYYRIYGKRYSPYYLETIAIRSRKIIKLED